ncbi:MAG: type II toxin-antitoxin system HicB family antitoxin [Phycisphaerae bacterium]|nr:type II toxin-antitoxin system HicB family antitoxin [Phycisphaerae bacterium]MDW8262477.1 type II toxin-antitoxin system HicB family antitoxin [Phycisphaerales bacterium]
MRQCYHTIYMQRPDGWYVGWVEEIRGTITAGPSLDECRRNLKNSLELILQTHREEAREPLTKASSFITEPMEVEVPDFTPA